MSYGQVNKQNGDIIPYAGSAIKVFPNASQVPYDNTDSGMTATQVQEAVDELKSGLTGKQNIYGSPTKIGEITVGSTTIEVTATKNGFISLVYEMSSANMNIKGKIRDANMPQLGASFDIVADAYTSEPICTIPCNNGHSYSVSTVAGHNGISIYQF